MKVNEERIIAEFGLVPFGAKGWMKSDEIVCPNCQKSGKFGIKFSKNSGAIHCFKCEHSANLIVYLKEVGRKDLIEFEQTVSINGGLVKPVFEAVEVEEELPEVSLPKGYTRINYDAYLSDRNFKSYQYDQFEVGITNHFLESRLHNYLIFVLKQKGRIVGWLARSKYSKEWHKKNLEDSKQGLCTLQLRYMNSTGTDFEKILGGIDEITENTHTVIAVEGLFDKTNVSNLLRTNESEELKVLMTFGNKFSSSQLRSLRQTNVENVILMYDPGTISQSKQYSLELSRWFNVDVCLMDKTRKTINGDEVDPGNIDIKYLFEVLSKRQNFLYFYHSTLSTNLEKEIKLKWKD